MIMMKHLIMLLVVFSSCLDIEAQQDINPVLKCEGCIAVVSEIHKILVRPSRRNIQFRVADSLQGLCEIDNLRTYKFSPPLMIKACNYFLQNYKLDFIPIFIDNYRDATKPDFDHLLDEICWTRTQLCHGLTKKAEEKIAADLLYQDWDQELLTQEEDSTLKTFNISDSNPNPISEELLIEEEVEVVTELQEVKGNKGTTGKTVNKQENQQDKQGKKPKINQDADIEVQSKGKQDLKNQKYKNQIQETTNKLNAESKIKKRQTKQDQEQEATKLSPEAKQGKNRKVKSIKSKQKEQVEKNKGNLKVKNKDKLGKEHKGKKGSKNAKDEL